MHKTSRLVHLTAGPRDRTNPIGNLEKKLAGRAGFYFRFASSLSRRAGKPFVSYHLHSLVRISYIRPADLISRRTWRIVSTSAIVRIMQRARSTTGPRATRIDGQRDGARAGQKKGATKELSKLSESRNGGTRTSDMSYKLFHSTAYNLTGPMSSRSGTCSLEALASIEIVAQQFLFNVAVSLARRYRSVIT